jgi:DNA-binding FadR family transcriptional regulator
LIPHLVESPALPPATSAAVEAAESLQAGERGYQRLAEQIMGLLASGEFPVGARLPSERGLADRFNVSRTAVREAVIALEVQELVEVRMGSGIYVKDLPGSFKPAYVHAGPGPFELLQARRLLEGEIAAQAAGLWHDRDLDRIQAALAEMRLNFHDKPANAASDLKFHLRIAESTGNAVLVQMVTALWEQLRGPIWERLEEHFHTPVMRHASLTDHQLVLNAIASRDSGAARAAMHQHIDRVVSEFVKGWS